MKYWYGYYYEHAQIDEHVILLESFHGKNISDSPLVCVREIEKLWPGKYKMYYATNNKATHERQARELGLNVEMVDIFSKKYAKLLATAGTIISNASLPIYYIRKEGQTYLQTWHGTPWKTLGKKMREGIESMYNVQHNFIQASHLLFPNDFTKEAIMRDYNLESLYTGRVIMCGYPRNEVFLKEEQNQLIREKHGLVEKTAYAYMPTWRGTSNRDIESDGYFDEVRNIFDKLDSSMNDEQIMFVNFHPIISGSFSFEKYKHIKPFPSDVSNYEFLNACDALVTDYSSVFFDYSLTRKPIVLFAYDYDKYMKDRGVYFGIDELPFRKIYDKDEFIRCISDNECLGDSYSDSSYVDQYLKYDAVGNTEKLLRQILNKEDCGLAEIDYSANKERKIRVIAPAAIKGETELRTLARAANEENAVALMYRKWFKDGLGQMLHDKYNDDFDYIITTDTPPRSHFCQLKKKLGSVSAKNHIHENDVKRCFGDLDVDSKYIRHYGYAEEGYQADIKGAVRIEAEPETQDDLTVLVKYESPESLKFKKAVILDGRAMIAASRDLDEGEIEQSVIRYDFKSVIESFAVYNRERCTPAVVAEDEEGKRVLVCFTNKSKIDYIKQEAKNKEKAAVFKYSTAEVDLPKSYKRVNIKNILQSEDAKTRESISSLDMENEKTTMTIVPTMFSEDGFSVLRAVPVTVENAARQISCPGVFKGYHFDSKGFTVKAFLPMWDASDVIGAELRLGSKIEDVRIKANAEAHNVSGGCLATIRYNYADKSDLKPLRWNCGFILKYGGGEHFLPIRFETRLIRYTLKIRNVQSRLKEGYILYPYLGLGGILRLTYREETEYDTAAIRAKEVIAMAIHVLFGSFLRRENKYIVYEKFSKTAQDNSFYFFKYCMEELPESEKKKYSYVIDKRAGDYEFVKMYEPHVIQFMSIKHMLYALNAKLLISTDSPPHLYAWRTKPSFVYSRVRKKPVCFLQHGVTAMKRVDNLYGVNGSNPMKYFVTTSENEQRIVINDFGYARDNAPMVGFTRWDALEDKRNPDDRFILVMPTWRAWLEDASEEDFVESDYYQNYYEVLTSDVFGSMLEENGLRAVLYLHPKFASYIETFRNKLSDRIDLKEFGSDPLNELMMRASMLITDYSSVCWDVLFMDKPVIFFQFDTDKYMQAHGSYIDLKHDLPSPRVTDATSLMEEIKKCIDRDFTIEDKYEGMLDKFFAYRDKKNCERTYNFLKQREEK